MLLKRPLDLVGTMPSNRVVGERHPLTTESEKVFTLELGSFYTDSVVIRDVGTGKVLVKERDYKLLGYNQKASKASGGKQVDTIVVITRSDVAIAAVDYQAVGGVYSNLSLPFVELLDQVKNTDRSKIDWMEEIIDKPETVNPTPHTHELRELSEIEDGVSGLTRLLAAIYSLDEKDYKGVYQALYNKMNTVKNDLDQQLDFINSELDLVKSKSEYLPGDVIVGDFDKNPAAYYSEVDWVLLPESFLYGNTMSSGTDPVAIDVAAGTGLAARTTHIYVAVPKGGARYSLTRDKTILDEGDGVSVILTALGASPGDIIPYVITGISQDDIQESLTGNFVLDSNLMSVVKINTVKDYTTEGEETLRLSLKNDPTIFTTVKIRDTSKTPVFDAYYSSDVSGLNRITTLNEGDKGYFQIRTTNVPEDTLINLFYEGTANWLDFDVTFPNSATINGSALTIPVNPVADQTTEGNEVLLIKVSMSTLDKATVAAALTIVDTSKTPSYDLYFSNDAAGLERITRVDEGSAFYLQVVGNNVANGTVVSLSYGGTADIFDLENRYDNLSLMNGRASGRIGVRADFTTEGDESLIVNAFVNGKLVKASTLTISDTSASANTSIKFSSNSTGTNVITQINEGDTFYLVVNALANLPDGTILDVRYEGTASDADFTKARAKSATVLNKRAVIEYTTVADLATEGDEIMRVRLINTASGLEIGTADIVIKDTSQAISYDVFYSASATSDTPITSINEGQTAYLTVKGTNVPNGKILSCEQYIGGLLAITTNGDVDVNPPTTITINGNRGSIPIAIRADMRTEGNEPLLGIVKDGSSEVGRKEITVIDTSITPTYKMWFAATEDGDFVDSRRFHAGQDVWLVVETTGVVPGTRMYIGSYEGNPGNLTNTPTEIIQSAKSRTSIKIGTKVLYNGGWSVGCYLYSDASRTQAVASNWIEIGSSIPDMYYSSNAAGSNRLTTFNEDDVVYLHIVFPSVANGVVVGLVSSIAGSGPQAANGHVWEDVNEQPVVNNLRAYTTIKLKGDQKQTGDFEMFFQINGTNYKTTATIRDTSLPPETVITIPTAYNNKYVLADELFKKVTGRYSQKSDKVRFIVPQGVNLIGIPVYFSYFDIISENPEPARVYTHPTSGLDLNMAADDITVEVYGSVVGVPLNCKTKLETAPAEELWDIYKGSYAAIGTRKPTRLIIRSTGKVLGHGGWNPAAPAEVELISQPNGSPFTTGKGSDALGRTGLTDDTNPVYRVRIDPGGLLEGGGGGGGQGGTVFYSILTPVYCPMAAIGGGGAPYGGREFILQGNSGDPVSPIKFTYRDLAPTPPVCTWDNNRSEQGYSESATLTTGGKPLPRYTTSDGLRRDYVAGAGGAPGQPGQAGMTYAFGNLPQATRESLSRPGAKGSINEENTVVIYDNTIA